MSNTPIGFKRIEAAEVYMSAHEIVVTGIPEDDDESHNCDHMGCSSVNHVIFRAPLSNPEPLPIFTPGDKVRHKRKEHLGEGKVDGLSKSGNTVNVKWDKYGYSSHPAGLLEKVEEVTHE